MLGPLLLRIVLFPQPPSFPLPTGRTRESGGEETKTHLGELVGRACLSNKGRYPWASSRAGSVLGLKISRRGG